MTPVTASHTIQPLISNQEQSQDENVIILHAPICWPLMSGQQTVSDMLCVLSHMHAFEILTLRENISGQI